MEARAAIPPDAAGPASLASPPSSALTDAAPSPISPAQLLWLHAEPFKAPRTLQRHMTTLSASSKNPAAGDPTRPKRLVDIPGAAATSFAGHLARQYNRTTSDVAEAVGGAGSSPAAAGWVAWSAESANQVGAESAGSFGVGAKQLSIDEIETGGTPASPPYVAVEMMGTPSAPRPASAAAAGPN